LRPLPVRRSHQRPMSAERRQPGWHHHRFRRLNTPSALEKKRGARPRFWFVHAGGIIKNKNVGGLTASSSAGQERNPAFQIRRHKMRVVIFVKATEDSEQGRMPTTELLEAMTNYNEQLINAGIMLGGDGLQPSSAGKRVR